MPRSIRTLAAATLLTLSVALVGCAGSTGSGAGRSRTAADAIPAPAATSIEVLAARLPDPIETASDRSAEPVPGLESPVSYRPCASGVDIDCELYGR